MRKLTLLISAVLVALIAAACIPPPPPPPPSGPHRDVVMFGDSNAWGIGCYLGHEGLASNGPPLPCNPQPDFSTQNEALGACSIAGGQTLMYSQFVLEPSCANWRSAWPGILDERTPELAIINTGAWEINDRWINFPPGCSTFNAFNCPAPDYQWGSTNPSDPALVTAQQRYKGELDDAIDLIRSKGAKVLVINSPYYDPREAQVPGTPLVWYERYPNDGGSGDPERTDWVAPNVNLTYRPSERKIDQFNAALKQVVDAKSASDPGVGFLDLWDITSPFNPATGDKEANDFLCAPPNNGQWPQNFCPNSMIPMHTEDHGHFSQAGYEQVVMPFVFTKVRQMLP